MWSVCRINLQFHCIIFCHSFAEKKMSLQLYLFLFLLFFYLIVFFLRSYLLWKNTGINPMTFDGSDDAHDFNGKLFKVISLLELVVVSVYAFKNEWYTYLLPVWYLEHSYLQWIGWIMIHTSLIWIFVAQLQMANSWRIGIDKEHQTELITRGFFTISRNPIFLGIMAAVLGLFMIIPNAFTLLIMVLSFSSIHTQVRLEEVFLRKEHGGKYVEYCEKVKRWM